MLRTFFVLALALASANAFIGLAPAVQHLKGNRTCRGGLRMTIEETGVARLDQFLKDSELLGPVRFVCMNNGAIIETVGSFENLRVSESEARGRFATFSDDAGDFEVHINTGKIASIKMLTQEAKSSDKQLYLTRFLDADGNVALTAMLHATDGVYEDGAVAYWEKLRGAFGEEQKIQ